MKPTINDIRHLSRRKFLQTCGSVLAGGTIFGISGVLLHRVYMQPRNSQTGGDSNLLNHSVESGKDAFKSPYKLVSSFSTPDQIEGFELVGDRLIVATSNNLSIYDQSGILLNNFAIGSNIRDIAVEKETIYLLFPARIEVYNTDGDWLRDWEACSDKSDYCSFAVTPESVFVTDAGNKNICKYTSEGRFVKFIQSPDGFIIPSYSFGITYAKGSIFCSNSGRHRVENYTLDGEYIGSFGKPGGAAGLFCGCCNPVHLSYNTAGEIITSEKGNPRISCYSPKGVFRSVLLDKKALGGGNVAYDVKVSKDKLFVAGKNVISTFQYDKLLATETACSDCAVDCPLREGITI